MTSYFDQLLNILDTYHNKCSGRRGKNPTVGNRYGGWRFETTARWRPLDGGPTEAVSSSASHPIIKWQGGEEIFICRFFGCLSCIKKYIYDTTFEAVN